MMIEIEIDGKKIKSEPGKMIIEVADAEGIYIPRFCYHKHLTIAANCRMCLVEVEKSRKPLPACATPVAEGMKVMTQSAEARYSQKAVMEFLLINHPLDCPICDQGGECELQDLSLGFGKDISRFSEGKRSVFDEDLGPLIATDMTRCIHCTRCVRFGQEIAGLEELGVLGRSEHERIGTEVLELRNMHPEDLEASREVGGALKRMMRSEVSGNVIDLCPVGALTSKPYRFTARGWEMQQHETIAPHDCLGSHIYAHSRGYEYSQYRYVMRVVPAECPDINKTWISDQDRFSYEGLHSDERLAKPMIKHHGQWQAVDWSIALNFVADRLKVIREQKGAKQIGALISPNATLEEHYLWQKLWRGFGSHNIDHRLQQSDFSDDDKMPYYPELGLPLNKLKKLNNILLIGSQVHREQPVASVLLREAVRGGTKVFAINPAAYDYRFTVSDQIVTVNFIQTLAGIAKALEINEPLLGEVTPTEQERTLAKALWQGEKRAIILGAIALNHTQASAIKALAGLIAKRIGANVGVLTSGANSVGAWLAGSVPHREAGGREVEKPGLHAEAVWKKALSAYALFDIEPEFDCANASQAMQALQEANFIVSFSAFASTTQKQYADAILPIAPFTENVGTLVSIENRWQGLKPVTSPWKEVKQGWKVLRVLGNLFEVPNFNYVSCEEITEELKEITGDEGVESIGGLLPEQLAPVKQLYRIGYWPLYRGDTLVRRANALQQTILPEEKSVRINASLAQQLGLFNGGQVIVKQGDSTGSFMVCIDNGIADNVVVLPAGLIETAGFGNAFGPVELEV